MANTYETSDGKRLTKTIIDRKIREAKAQKLQDMMDDFGYHFCEMCGTHNDRLDCSHTISVKEAQETGQSELAWDVNNIKIRCRRCHNDLDLLFLH